MNKTKLKNLNEMSDRKIFLKMESKGQWGTKELECEKRRTGTITNRLCLKESNCYFRYMRWARFKNMQRF